SFLRDLDFAILLLCFSEVLVSLYADIFLVGFVIPGSLFVACFLGINIG
ncbi:26262_t:CDS:2, partial [Gigaspora rosea]